jgi:hypothetical protein
MLNIARSLAVVALVPADTIFTDVDVWVTATALSDCSQNPRAILDRVQIGNAGKSTLLRGSEIKKKADWFLPIDSLFADSDRPRAPLARLRIIRLIGQRLLQHDSTLRGTTPPHGNVQD